jgi:hypothetical protein
LIGYGSQTYVDDVIADVRATGRPAVLLYAGDHDPRGEDIDRDFTARTDCWDEVRRVALTAEQVERYALPPQPGKDTDSRAAGFIARHGRLVHVELDALPPDVLRALYADAIAEFWNDDAHDATLEREAAERRTLQRGGRQAKPSSPRETPRCHVLRASVCRPLSERWTPFKSWPGRHRRTDARPDAVTRRLPNTAPARADVRVCPGGCSEQVPRSIVVPRSSGRQNGSPRTPDDAGDCEFGGGSR